ncbi:MAG TPA: VOC family protein [Ferrovibrio sp.]|jgi:catechol 2,3-dioxygenase-like lactoylglutathione lyase family enzyme|uniref:VOC family protein n=1 Tax=Ferrovibrio sp. TaxID=1917215 RepID=UPI002B4B7C10|nr:VOC family protein [Ferrovibrio sp.]HLT77983.1 VOC family protein [Ferrovibrio sp.]
MQFHRGRLIDHVHLVVRDLGASRRFYEAAFTALGLKVEGEGPGFFHCDEFYVSNTAAHEDFHLTGRAHIAFQAPDEATVQRFHAAVLAAGGRDNGAPGLRSKYHPGYYAAFALDPDGNNIEAVFHGPSTRSAPSVVITPQLPPG